MVKISVCVCVFVFQLGAGIISLTWTSGFNVLIIIYKLNEGYLVFHISSTKNYCRSHIFTCTSCKSFTFSCPHANDTLLQSKISFPALRRCWFLFLKPDINLCPHYEVNHLEHTNSGVLQGSIFGPVTFTMYSCYLNFSDKSVQHFPSQSVLK